MSKLKRRTHSEEFKREAVKLVTDQGYSLAEAARNLGIHVNLLRTWKQKSAAEAEEQDLTEDERMELAQLRAEIKRLRMERDILKKATARRRRFEAPAGPSRTRSPEVRVYRTASRRMAGHGDVSGVGSITQRFLCVAEAFRELARTASAGVG